jgi:hypothetical protein
MAHERRPPPGYERCFRPTMILRTGVDVDPAVMRDESLRTRPLLDEEIVACEREFRSRVAR